MADNTDETADDLPEIDDGAESFPRSYVERLRRQAAGFRDRAQTAEARVEELTAAEARADELAQRLHAALVEQTGKLASADLLPFDPEHLDDADKLNDAIDALVTAKPYAKARRATGDIGQGATSVDDEEQGPTFSSLLRPSR